MVPSPALGSPRIRTVPKDDSGLSVSKAVYGSHLTVPGEFLGSPELPPTYFLRKIENTITGLAIPPPHHEHTSPPHQLQLALLMPEFVLVPEDASVNFLAPLYC